MKTTIKKSHVIATSATILLFASIIGIGFLQKSNTSLSELLNGAKLNYEKLLSEKLTLDKQIVKLKNDMGFLNDRNMTLDKKLAQADQLISQKEAQIKRLNNEVRNNPKTKKLEKQITEIQKIKEDLEKQILALNQNINQLRNDNDELILTIATLKNENNALAENINILKAIAADNFRVETVKGRKDRLTVNARRTKKLTVGFDVPQSIVTDINFKITTPDGKTLSNDESITACIIDDDKNLTASLSPFTEEFEISKRIEMTYKPKQKLTGGIYKIDIYNKEAKLGSCQVKLR